MQDIIMGDAPSAILYQPVFNGMYGKNVGGYYYHPVWNLSSRRSGSSTASEAMTVARRKASRRDDG